MKTLTELCMAVVLTLMLTMSALAGEIDIPGATPPPPPNTAVAQGEIEIPGAYESASSVTVIDAAVSLLVDVLSF